MRLLILGGTVFLGRHLVEAALVRGHEVTLFNRGQHNPDLFPEVEKLRGDRDGDLSALEGRRWDAVIDTCGYVPRVVAASSRMLSKAVDHYTFISSISVYADLSQPNIDELAPVGQMTDPSVEEVNGETYGPLKAMCELATEIGMPGRSLIIRPGLIVGPHDPSDRFTYWVHRVAEGGDVLAPDRPDYPVEIIDARDLAEWTLSMAEGGQTGVYNATGPDYRLTLGRVLDECKTVSGSDAHFVWVSPQFLTEAGVGPWIELPLWLGADDRDSSELFMVNCDKAIAAGLTFRPLTDIVRDTLEWDRTRPADTQRRAGLTRERETELLKSWQQQHGG